MMMMILAMIMIFKCLLSAIDFATRYSTRYSDFLSQPYSNPTRSQKALLAGAWVGNMMTRSIIIAAHLCGCCSGVPQSAQQGEDNMITSQ